MKKIYTNFLLKYPILGNMNTKYALALLLFSVWMFFLDSYSILEHRKINAEIDKLEANKNYYIEEIKKDKKSIESYKSLDQIEKFAREKYYMKKENEDIFIIDVEEEENDI